MTINKATSNKLGVLTCDTCVSCEYYTTTDHEVREHIPGPYDNLFQSILSYASPRQSYF